MRTWSMQRRMLAAFVVATIVVGSAFAADVVPNGKHAETPRERPDAPASPEASRIRELDQQIQTLRAQFKSQADPLQAQLKALRDKLDADLKPLADERKDLVRRGESPELRALDDDEDAQLASLAEREKAEVDKVHQTYAAERTTLKASFDQKRKDLRAHH